MNLNAEMQVLSLHAKFDTLIATRLEELEARLAAQAAVLERLASPTGEETGGAESPAS